MESDAFEALLDQLVSRVKRELGVTPDKWISKEEAKQLLRISSDTTLQRYRDEGRIRYSQPDRKLILYDRDSIMLLLDQNVVEPFQ